MAGISTTEETGRTGPAAAKRDTSTSERRKPDGSEGRKKGGRSLPAGCGTEYQSGTGSGKGTEDVGETPTGRDGSRENEEEDTTAGKKRKRVSGKSGATGKTV